MAFVKTETVQRSWIFRGGLGAVLAVYSLSMIGAGAQTGAQTLGCSLQNQAYTCSQAAFRKVLREAQTVAIEGSPRDRMARRQVEELVRGLGKTVQTTEDPADLIFAILPTESNDIEVGPADRELGSLRVYARGTGGGHGPLVWAETFRGQPDRPWPAVVHSLIEQFRARFDRR